jgi:hypothetical protein
MLALCRARAEREGLPPPNLYQQAMHELDLPRKYRTVYLCGGFGLGGNRQHDEVALRRIYEHLEPGGSLILDNEVPHEEDWRQWTDDRRRELPEPWPESGDRRTGSDGTEYELRSRVIEVDPTKEQLTLQIRGSMWREGKLVERDEHVLKMTIYTTNYLRPLLERAGFRDIEVRGDYEDEEPTDETAFVVFTARRPT